MGSLLPLVLMAHGALTGNLGANPIERILNQTGLLALILLLASLALTPLRLLSSWTWPARLRRLLGLLAFTYALLHFLTYAVLDRGLQLGALAEDIAKRPFITVGFVALVLLIPLAVTSTKGSVRRLGYQKWQRLHQLVYLAAALGILHFIWRVKRDATEPFIYAALLVCLFAVRIIWAARKRRETPRLSVPVRNRDD